MSARSVSRNRLRKVRAGGWLVSLLVAGLGIGLLCSYGKTACLLGLFLGVCVVVVWHRWMKQEGGVPVLTYHSVTPHGAWLPWSSKCSVAPETFERHLQVLQRLQRRVIRTSELVHARQSGEPLPERAIVIHFDDGYLDNWVAACPILKRFGMPATLFVSLDFIEPGETPRPTLDDVAAGRCRAEDLQWEGYLNWAELRLMQASGLIDVEAHGIDHGRVEVGPRVVDTVRPENWRRLAWVQWRAMPGNKSNWFHHSMPPVTYGTAVRQNEPALAARAWHDGRLESEEEYEARVYDVLKRSRDVLGRRLNKDVRIFCWPEDAGTARARELALAAGYLATTGGGGENRPDEDPSVISRVHVNDRTLGWKWLAAEDFAMIAKIRLWEGNYYWYLLVPAAKQCRWVVSKLRPHLLGRQP